MILAARSPALKRMLVSGEAVTARRLIEMRSINSGTLRLLCEFLYSGTLQDAVWCDDDAARGLLKAAAEYELVALTGICEANVQRRIEVRNVADWLRVAVEVSADGLRRHCLQFVAENLTRVLATVGWERLMSDRQLVAELAPQLLQLIGELIHLIKGPKPHVAFSKRRRHHGG